MEVSKSKPQKAPTLSQSQIDDTIERAKTRVKRSRERVKESRIMRDTTQKMVEKVRRKPRT